MGQQSSVLLERWLTAKYFPALSAHHWAKSPRSTVKLETNESTWKLCLLVDLGTLRKNEKLDHCGVWGPRFKESMG